MVLICVEHPCEVGLEVGKQNISISFSYTNVNDIDLCVSVLANCKSFTNKQILDSGLQHLHNSTQPCIFCTPILLNMADTRPVFTWMDGGITTSPFSEYTYLYISIHHA